MALDVFAPPRRIQVVVNPVAGQDRPILPALNEVFASTDVRWDVSITNQAGDAERFAREAAAGGVEVVAVYGGDGTVAEVAAGLEGGHVPMALLRGGTANVFADEVGVPADLAEAAALITNGTACVKPVDIAETGGQRFLVRLGIGLEADTVDGATREDKDRFGVLAYPLAALRASTSAPVVRYAVTFDGNEVEAEGVTCIIANSGGLGRLGLRLAPDIVVDDGLLDVVVMRSVDLTSVLELAATMASSSAPSDDVTPRWKAREVTVVARPEQSVVRDGETAGVTPVSARILPGAARVLVPCA